MKSLEKVAELRYCEKEEGKKQSADPRPMTTDRIDKRAMAECELVQSI